VSTPWFLERLGLDDSADERAIKRAYATQLKKIDQTTDIAGFTELQRTYQATLAWHAQRTQPIANNASAQPIDAPPRRETTLEHAREDIHESDHGSIPPGEAALAAHAHLIERLTHGIPVDLALSEQLNALRMGHLQAPFLFELRLIESLANGGISQRLELFNAAQKHFSWKDIGHLNALGQHGSWVNSVKKESHAWSQESRHISGVMLLDALKLGSTSPLPSANQWPRIQVIIQRYPCFLSLQLDRARLSALQQAFDALPDNEKNWALDTSMPVFQLGNTQTGTVKRTSRTARPVGLVIVAILIAARVISAIVDSGGASYTGKSVAPPASTLLALNLQRFVPTQQSCQSLIPIVERTAPFQNDERTYLSAAVRSCIGLDYWPSDHRDDDALRRLGI
jgi:hypothetical protein